MQLISAFVFATQIVQSHFFLNPKFQESSHLLRLYSLVYVEPLSSVLSRRGSYIVPELVFSWRLTVYLSHFSELCSLSQPPHPSYCLILTCVSCNVPQVLESSHDPNIIRFMVVYTTLNLMILGSYKYFKRL